MKKIYALILAMLMVFCVTACGEQTETKENEQITTEEIVGEKPTQVESKFDSDSSVPSGDSFEEIEELVAKDVEDTIEALVAELEKLSTDSDTYGKYQENVDKIETFYTNTFEETEFLCIRMRQYSLDYAEVIMSSDKSNDEKYDELEKIYDCIYDEAGDDIYDEIYDGILDEMYDIFYDGILDDAYDTVAYSEWSDARSNEYEWWSATRSDVYDEWSDFRSDVYDFWSDMRGNLWDNDVERAEKIMNDFKEDIEKLRGNDTSANYEKAKIQDNIDTLSEDSEIVETSEEFVDGMRPEFKDAMDSYETFYDEYCELMIQYNENPSDFTLLDEYADMLSNAADMNKAFEEWDKDEMNDTELKYYLEVNSRVMQKLVDVVE